MKLKTVEITELKGVNRNAVEGVTQMQPTVLKNFDFDRAGGYRATFGVDPLTISGTIGVSSVLVGSDNAGLVSFRDYDTSTSYPRGEVTMRVYDGTSTVQEVVDGFDGTAATSTISTNSATLQPVHMNDVGLYAYGGDNQDLGINDANYDGPIYLVKDSQGVWHDHASLEASTLSVSSASGTTVSGASPAFSRTTIPFYAGYATNAGTFLARYFQYSFTGLGADPMTAFSITLSYSGAPSNWFIVAMPEETNPPGRVAYQYQPANASGTAEFSFDISQSTFFGGSAGVFIGSFTAPTEFHKQRVWGTFNRDTGVEASPTNRYIKNFQVVGNGDINDIAPLLKRLPQGRTLWYTNIGYANLWAQENYVVVNFQAGGDIIGLSSSPAGLLVFGESETHLIRSDPALSDFGVQVASGVIGMDDGTQPVRLGGTVFVVYKGEVYAFALGMGDVDFGQGIKKISDPVFIPSDPFQYIASEPKSRHIVAMTESDRIYRFAAERGEWLADTYDEYALSVKNVFSNPDSDGVRYYINTTFGAAYGALDTPVVTWEDVDLGEKNRMKMWRRVYIQTNDSYSGTPTLGYVIDNTSGTVTGSDETGGRFSFTFPSGLVNEKAESLTLTLNGAVENDTIEPNVTVEFVERYRRR